MARTPCVPLMVVEIEADARYDNEANRSVHEIDVLPPHLWRSANCSHLGRSGCLRPLSPEQQAPKHISFGNVRHPLRYYS